MLLWSLTDSVQESVEEKALGVFLLTRVTFSPFGGTAIEFNMTGEKTAQMAIENGQALFHPLPRLLYKYSLENNHYFLKTARYKAISLHEIKLDLDTVQDSNCLPPEPVGPADADADADDDGPGAGNDDDDDDDSRLKSLASLLKVASGKVKKKALKVKRQPNRAKSSVTMTSAKRFSRKVGHEESSGKLEEHPEFPGAAGDHHDDIVCSWASALESDLGPVPPEVQKVPKSTSKLDLEPDQDLHQPHQKSEPSSSSKTSASKTKSKVPIVSMTLPWKDDAGHSWVYNESTQLPLHLGQILKNIFSHASTTNLFVNAASSIFFSLLQTAIFARK